MELLSHWKVSIVKIHSGEKRISSSILNQDRFQKYWSIPHGNQPRINKLKDTRNHWRLCQNAWRKCGLYFPKKNPKVVKVSRVHERYLYDVRQRYQHQPELSPWKPVKVSPKSLSPQANLLPYKVSFHPKWSQRFRSQKKINHPKGGKWCNR